MAHLNSWPHLLLEEGINYTGEHSVHHRFLLWETVDLEEVLVMVVAQSCSLSSHISLVSFICIAAVKAGIPRLNMEVRGLGISKRGWHINRAGSGDGIGGEWEGNLQVRDRQLHQ